MFNTFDTLCDKLYQVFRDVAKSKLTEEEEGSVLYLVKRHMSGKIEQD